MKTIKTGNIIIYGALSLLIAGLIVVAVYFYQRYQTIKNNPSIISKEEVKAVTSAIGRFMVLPTDEEPTVATVTDIKKLQGQDFFKKAMNGDKLLLYTKARKAILYRPTTNKIIEFSALTIGNQNAATPEGQIQEPVTIAIYNGTKVANLTGEVEKTLATFTGITVVAKTNAAKNDYTKTIVVDISGNNSGAAAQIAQLLGGTVENNLPSGETTPQADILVIAAK